MRVLQGRFGNGAGGIVLLGIPLLSFFNGTVISMGTNARMLWAFSRDRGQLRDASLMMDVLCVMPYILIVLEITLAHTTRFATSSGSRGQLHCLCYHETGPRSTKQRKRC